MDFIQLRLFHAYNYALVMVCSFHTGGKEAFPCRPVTLSSVAKVLLEKTSPTWRSLLKLHSDLGIHVSGEALQQVCAAWLFLHFPCSYHPQSSTLAECNNSVKTHLAKFVEALQMPWPKARLLILLNPRFTSLGGISYIFTLWDSHGTPNALGSCQFWLPTDKRRDIPILQRPNCFH